MQIINLTRGLVIAKQVQLATSFWQRFKGLMGTASLAEDSGLLIKPCSSIHTCFMKYPIDVVFVDNEERIIRILHTIRPFQFGPLVPSAVAALELPSGRCLSTGTRVGDLIKLKEV